MNDKKIVGFDSIRHSFFLFAFLFQIALYNSYSWAIFMQPLFTAWRWKGWFGLLVLLKISQLAKFVQIPLKPPRLSSQKGTASEGKRNKSLWNANGVEHFLPFQEIIYPFGKFVKRLALMKIFSFMTCHYSSVKTILPCHSLVSCVVKIEILLWVRNCCF